MAKHKCFGQNHSKGLIGLAITYALSFTGIFNGLLCSFIETEKGGRKGRGGDEDIGDAKYPQFMYGEELVSVERICDYVENVPTEGGGEEQDPGADAFGRIVVRPRLVRTFRDLVGSHSYPFRPAKSMAKFASPAFLFAMRRTCHWQSGT